MAPAYAGHPAQTLVSIGLLGCAAGALGSQTSNAWAPTVDRVVGGASAELGETADDTEPQTDARGGASYPAAALLEPFEQRGHQVLGHTGPGVSDCDDDAVSVGVYVDPDRWGTVPRSPAGRLSAVVRDSLACPKSHWLRR